MLSVTQAENMLIKARNTILLNELYFDDDVIEAGIRSWPFTIGG
jgi:hypothetical protein